jgi:hypothetical protein
MDISSETCTEMKTNGTTGSMVVHGGLLYLAQWPKGRIRVIDLGTGDGRELSNEDYTNASICGDGEGLLVYSPNSGFLRISSTSVAEPVSHDDLERYRREDKCGVKVGAHLDKWVGGLAVVGEHIYIAYNLPDKKGYIAVHRCSGEFIKEFQILTSFQPMIVDFKYDAPKQQLLVTTRDFRMPAAVLDMNGKLMLALRPKPEEERSWKSPVHESPKKVQIGTNSESCQHITRVGKHYFVSDVSTRNIKRYKWEQECGDLIYPRRLGWWAKRYTGPGVLAGGDGILFVADKTASVIQCYTLDADL